MPANSTTLSSSPSAAADAAPQSSASTPTGSSARDAVDAMPTLKNDADETCDPDALLSPDRVASSPLPGVVLLRHALDAAGQREALQWALRHGIDRRAWLDEEGALNAPRQFRGRCYDAVEAVDRRAGALSDALQKAAKQAYEEVDPVGASTTHLLMLFYANLARGLGWHRDNGRSDGRDLTPVVSLSLGAACSFRMKHGPNEPETVVQLESGDAILFGGPARHVMHCVTDLQKGTCPAHLRDLVRGRVPGDPAEWRLNLTWRHAPELRGLEGGDRFHILGSPTSNFVAAAREKGLDAARAEANARKLARKQKKARRRFGTDCALGAGCDRPCCAPAAILKPAAEEPPPPAYLMVLYLVGPVALGVGAARVARWVFESGAAG
jgi:alkylated DNA repair dioxygenase AlkB